MVHKSTSLLLIGILAMLALASAMPALAQAEPFTGPSWQVGGKRLGAESTVRTETKTETSSTATIDGKTIITININITFDHENQDGSPAKAVGTGTLTSTSKGATISEFPECRIKSKGEEAGNIGTKANLEMVYIGEGSKKTTAAGLLVTGSGEFEGKKEVLTVLELSGSCPAALGKTVPVTGTMIVEMGVNEKESEKGIFKRGLAKEEALIGALNSPEKEGKGLTEMFKWNPALESYVKTAVGLKAGGLGMTIHGNELQYVVNEKNEKTGETFGFTNE
jgi:hypothetical protein